MKRCGGRKEVMCKTIPEMCIWKDEKCQKISETPLTTSKTRCAGRKEKGCKEVEILCKWENDKCKDKEKTTTISCTRRKEPSCKKEPLCKWENDKCAFYKVKSPTRTPIKVKSPTKTPIKVKSPTGTHPPPYLQDMENRHCMYYSHDTNVKIDEIADLQKSKKERYDPTFKALSNIHLGQRKLLLSEIQMLTKYYASLKKGKRAIVLYVGAAHGTHLILLSYMFPQIYFILYDGAKFDPILKKYPKIYELHEGKEGFVTNDVIKGIKDKLPSDADILFISDIRLGSEDRVEFERGVSRDMSLQEEWMEILKPKLSLLKFRISYNMKHGEKYKYTKGDILYGIWPTPLSGETRLLVSQKDIGTKINYDFKDYEEMMFYHNKYDRSFCYPIEKIDETIKKIIDSKNNAYCPCYDCMSELNALLVYSKVMKQDLGYSIQQFAKFMNKTKKMLFQKGGPKRELQPLII